MFRQGIQGHLEVVVTWERVSKRPKTASHMTVSGACSVTDSAKGLKYSWLNGLVRIRVKALESSEARSELLPLDSRLYAASWPIKAARRSETAFWWSWLLESVWGCSIERSLSLKKSRLPPRGDLAIISLSCYDNSNMGNTTLFAQSKIRVTMKTKLARVSPPATTP